MVPKIQGYFLQSETTDKNLQITKNADNSNYKTLKRLKPTPKQNANKPKTDQNSPKTDPPTKIYSVDMSTAHPYQKRLLKEYKSMQKMALPGVVFLEEQSSPQSYLFHLLATEPSHPVYKTSEKFTLHVLITKDYPVDLPQVTFTAPVPLHPHIYLNGHICLNLLGNDWTPACGIEAIVLSIQSMLNNNQVAERPPDDADYMKRAPKNPKNTTFVYHDDTV